MKIELTPFQILFIWNWGIEYGGDRSGNTLKDVLTEMLEIMDEDEYKTFINEAGINEN